MLKIGAHVSISGGFPKAVKRQKELKGNCGQIFVGSPRGWKTGDIDEEESQNFQKLCKNEKISPWIVHGTYLINFATPKKDLGKKSVDTVQKELKTTASLGIKYYVFHPGAHTGAGKKSGIENVADRLSKLEIPEGVTLLLENTAGKGTTVGKCFEELKKMVDRSSFNYSKIGFCLDTCHLYSAGYEFTTEQSMGELIREIDSVLGIDNIHYLHLNDSKHPLGSEKDEHEHIGEGEIGEKGFDLFINNEKLRDKPMVLETPSNDKGFGWNINKIKEIRKETPQT